MSLLISFYYLICCLVALVSANLYETNIIFRVFNSNGVQFNSTFSDNATLLANCNPLENYTVVVHGWEESIQSIWPKSVIENFVAARAGCVLFMDYYYYSQKTYLALVNNFIGIRAVLTRKLQQLDELGFDPANAHLFGFSFGSQVVFEGAYQYGVRKIARVDCCDPAGPAFPATALSVKHAKDSGQAVQCIHTSVDKGTSGRYCQKDIDMGNCGTAQDAATAKPLGNHGLCPIFYNNSFVNDFALVPQATIDLTYNVTCKNQSFVPDITALQPTQMGYWLDMSIPDGEYFSLTEILPPYNVI